MRLRYKKAGDTRRKEPVLRRIGRWGFCLAGSVLISLMFSGSDNPRQEPQDRITMIRKARNRAKPSPALEELRRMKFDWPRWEPPLTHKKIKRELRDATEEFLDDTNGSYRSYISFLESARFSNDDMMFPNAADAIRKSRNFSDEGDKRIAARRVVKTLRSFKRRRTRELLEHMPHTAITLTYNLNRSGSGMMSVDLDEMSEFFLAFLSAQRKGLTGEKLKAFDIHYSVLLLNRRDLWSMAEICKHCERHVKNGDFDRFGAERKIGRLYPNGIHVGYCTPRKRRDPEKAEELDGRFRVRK